MSNKFETVATFPNLPAAEACKAMLEMENLTVVLADAETVNMDWLLGNAIGFIKLQVPTDQVEAAQKLVEQMRGERQRRLDHPDRDEKDKCLACGAVMPEVANECPACGWTYEENVASSPS